MAASSHDDHSASSPSSGAARARARREDVRMHTVEMAALVVEPEDEHDVLGSGPVPEQLARWRIAALVAAGGAIGAIARWVLGLIEPSTTTPTLIELPLATLAVNVVGCLLLGVLTGEIEVRGPVRAWVRPFAGPGLCGGFTTMSTLVLEGSAMVGAGFSMLAAIYGIVTLILSFAATALGLALGTRIGRALRTYETLRPRVEAAITPATDPDQEGTA